MNTVTAEDAHALYAPMDGTVLTVPQAGESVSADMPCIQIANPDKLRVRAQSPELYVGELSGSALTSHFRQWTVPFTPD